MQSAVKRLSFALLMQQFAQVAMFDPVQLHCSMHLENDAKYTWSTTVLRKLIAVKLLWEMIWGQGKVSQDAQQRKDSTICNAMYNAICSQKTELCFANAAICFSAHVAMLDPVQLHSRLMLNMPGSLQWTIRLTAFSWTDGANHQNNAFGLLKYICCFSGSALIMFDRVYHFWKSKTPGCCELSRPQIAEDHFQREDSEIERDVDCWPVPKAGPPPEKIKENSPFAQNRTENKVTTRWEGPQSLSYHKQWLGTEKRWPSVCTLMFNQILTSNQSYGDLPPLCVGPL